MTPRQERFVEEYLIDLNGTQAAIRAGYSPKTANEQAARLLTNASVADAVARAKAERSARVGLHQDRVIEELAVIGFARMTDFAEWGKVDGNLHLFSSDDVDGRAIAQIVQEEKFIKTLDNGDQLYSRTQSVKLHDKLGALEKLGKHLGMYPEKHEYSGPGGGPVEIDVKPRDYRAGLAPFLPPESEPDAS